MVRIICRYSLVSLLVLLGACGENDTTQSNAVAANGVSLDVYKSETCGCCGIWTEYMQANGYDIRIHHPDDLNGFKEQAGIKPQWQSCHTAVTENGLVFEGHIPARFVSEFLANPPSNAIGLAVPGMPLGSPGMEVGDRFTPYEIVQINKDGSTTTYATISAANEQF